MTLQHVELTASFEQSTMLMEHRYNMNFFENVRGVVSRQALDMIYRELDRSKKVGIDRDACGCILPVTHGLPCAYKLAEFSMYYKILPLSAIHPHWTKLYFQAPMSNGEPKKL
jgi:histone-lysine N-methyltransferase SETD2